MSRPHINGQTASVETRVAAALTSEITSDDLATLLDELEDAISNTEAEAEEKRRTAFDPIAMPDANAARASVETAEFAVQRLRTLLPKLERRYSQVREAEDISAWQISFDQIKLASDALELELRNTYPETCSRLAALFSKIADCNLKVIAVNAASPPGKPHLHGPDPSNIAKELRLPDFSDPTRMIFPSAAIPIGAQVALSMTPAHAHGEWWRTIDARNSERLRETEKVSEYYERQERQRAEREETEARERREADQRQHQERYGLRR